MAQITYVDSPSKSEDFLRQGLSNSPRSFALQKSMGILLADTQRFEEAISYLRQAYAQQSEDSFLLLYLAKALLGIERPNEARVYLKDILKNHPNTLSYEMAESLLSDIDG